MVTSFFRVYLDRVRTELCTRT